MTKVKVFQKGNLIAVFNTIDSPHFEVGEAIMLKDTKEDIIHGYQILNIVHQFLVDSTQKTSQYSIQLTVVECKTIVN